MRSIGICVGVALALMATQSRAQATWEYMVVNDPITDVKRGIASLTGPNGTLVVKCDKPGPSSVYVHVLSKKFLGSKGLNGSTQNLTYRFDGAPAVTEGWFYDRSAVAQIDTDKVAAFLSTLTKSAKLIMRATTFEGDQVDLQWDLANPKSTVERVYADCGAGGGPVFVPAGSRGELKKPVWEKLPDQTALRTWYPYQARSNRAGGRARFKCEVNMSIVLQNCQTVEETPQGQGFADALRSLMSMGYFKLRPTDADGEPVGGTTVTFGVEFTPR